MAGGWRRAGAALAYRDFRLFWTGAAISAIGTWMQNITVPFVLYELTDSAAWVGMATVAQILPSIVLNPLSGSLADRYSHRGQLRLAQIGAAIPTFAQAALWAAGVRSPTVILVLVAVGGTSLMLVQPAWQAFVADLVPEEHMLNALTLNSAQANAARAVGPALGGVIIATVGPGWAFLFNACSFVVVIAMLTLLHPPEHRGAPAARGKVLEQYREGWVYARRQTGLLTAYAYTAVVCGIGYPAFQLAAVMVKDVYDLGPRWYGALTGSYGVGAVIGAVLLGAFGATRSRATIMRAVVVVAGVGNIGFGLSTSFWAGAPMLALLGGGALCVVATLNTAIQVASPPGLRGRLLALWIMSYTIAYPVGSIVEGWLADVIGVRATVTGAGVLVLLAGVVLVLRADLARSLDGEPEIGVIDPLPAA